MTQKIINPDRAILPVPGAQPLLTMTPYVTIPPSVLARADQVIERWTAASARSR